VGVSWIENIAGGCGLGGDGTGMEEEGSWSGEGGRHSARERGPLALSLCASFGKGEIGGRRR